MSRYETNPGGAHNSPFIPQGEALEAHAGHLRLLAAILERPEETVLAEWEAIQPFRPSEMVSEPAH